MAQSPARNSGAFVIDTYMKSSTFILTGLDVIDKRMKLLPTKLERKVYRQSMRIALKPVKDKAKQLAPVLQKPSKDRVKGALRKAIVVRAARARRKNSISLNVQIGRGGWYSGDQFYAAFQEFSHKASRNKEIVIQGKHFMKQAYEQTKDRARTICIREILTRADNEISKLRNA